jgi:hypothetical protein
MEYSIGNIYIAFSWSGYFTNLLESFHIHLPDWLAINYKSAHAVSLANQAGEGLNAWKNAPVLGGLKIIFDLPAVIINDRYLIQGGQPVATFEQALLEIAAKAEDG